VQVAQVASYNSEGWWWKGLIVNHVPDNILDCEKHDETSLQAKPYPSGQQAEHARYGLKDGANGR